MISPSKILFLALCAAALLTYFSEKLILVTNKVVDSRKQVGPVAGNGLVYGETTMADYGREIHIPVARDGHYWVTLDVNGTPIRFVIDTGASYISLSYQDAEAVGLDPAGLNYDRMFRTANGITRKAIITLDRISLESIQISNIPASVSPRGHMDVSLLGMNFLSRLSSFKMENRELVLTP